MMLRQLDSIRSALEAQGVTVYLPAQHEGLCLSPYVVLQPLGEERNGRKRTGRAFVRLHFLVPLRDFSKMETLLQKAQPALKALERGGHIRRGSLGTAVVDEGFRAHCCRLDCEILFD